MTKPVFTNPNTLGMFSLASIFADSVARDWTQGYAERWEIVLPAPLLGDIAERAEDLLTDAEKAQAKREPYAAISEDLAERFQQSDARDEWAQGFDPMMNYAWPVDLGYEVEAQTAANLMAIFAPSCSLIERTEEDGDEPTFEIALTGGGMFLGDHIAAAYMCCGTCPPVGLLDRLNEAGDSYVMKRLPMGEVFARAAEHLRDKAARIEETAARVAEQNKAPA